MNFGSQDNEKSLRGEYNSVPSHMCFCAGTDDSYLYC